MLRLQTTLLADRGALVTNVSDGKQCFAAGMNAHIAKPIDMELLEKTLQRIYEQL